jgi:hypothetical protein
MSNPIMTLAEIEKQFLEEWVLLADPFLDEQKKVAGGTVLCHSKDRDEVDHVLLQIRPKHAAFLYTGQVGKMIALNL